MIKTKGQRGITLIALIITIIVLLILAVVAIREVQGDGIISKAKKAKEDYQRAEEEENSILQDWLDKINEVSGDGTNQEETFNAEKWDKNATPQDVFIWKSDDPASPDYGVIIGYTSNAQNYPILRYPSRTTKITFSYDAEKFSSIGNNYQDAMTSSRAFTNKILKVEIPETVTEIGMYAFGVPNVNSFINLSSIYIPENVQILRGSVFQDCNSLSKIYCGATQQPDGWDSSWKNGCSADVVWGSTMSNMPQIKEWDLTAALENAFIWKSNDPTSPDYGVIIGYTSNAQNYPLLRYPTRCTAITFRYDNAIWGGIKESQSRAFTNNVLKVEIPDTVTYIDSASFGTRIGERGFYSMTDLVVPGSVSSISNAFMDCKSLENVTLSEGITDISGAFKWCNNLKNITIPSTVTNIESAFYGCTSLAKVKIMSTTLDSVGNSSTFYNLPSASKIYVLNEGIKNKLSGTYDSTKTTVEVVTEEQMKDL